MSQKSRRTHFNPRSPHGERHSTDAPGLPTTCDFNPRSPHGERHYFVRRKESQNCISTHAPRTGSDTAVLTDWETVIVFQPTLPARGATKIMQNGNWQKRFQPTLPARGATEYADKLARCKRFQPTLPARGATQGIYFFRLARKFQPTLPARGATIGESSSRKSSGNFNPRSPHGERLTCVRRYPLDGGISTHAPRTGSDDGGR